MKNRLKQNSATILSLASLIINYFPYILYILLISRHGEVITNIIPLAIFYAFRRTALFIFRDFRKNSVLLGWLGLLFSLIGNLIGIFGVISDILFDVSAVFVGSAAAIFPPSINQNKRRLEQNAKNKAGQGIRSLVLLLMMIASMLIFAVIAHFVPTVAFCVLFLFTFVTMFAYYHIYGAQRITDQINFNWKNLILVLFLLIAMMLMEAGRKANSGNLLVWGVGCLVVFLVVLMLILLFGRQSHFSCASKDLYLQMMMYGACAMFWITYSAILITVVHGVNAFAGCFLAYLTAIILGKSFVNLLLQKTKIDSLTLVTFGIIFGILLTFWYPSYFVGIFLIRAFASYQKQIALIEYEKESNNSQDSYYLSYYLQTLSAFWTQTIMWVTLILCCRTSGLQRILHAITFNQIEKNYIGAIDLTHIILAIFMIGFVLATYISSKRMDGKD